MAQRTPLPLPTDADVEQAAILLARIAEIEPLQSGAVTFRRDNLAFVGWWDPDGASIDWDGSLDEIAVAVPEQFLDDVDVEGDRRRNVARCKLEIRHAIDRRDQEIVFIAEAAEEDN